MSIELFDEGEVAALVSVHHFRYELRTGDDFVADPAQVARRAEFLVRTRQRSEYVHQPSEIAFARCAGLLVYAMDRYAFDFAYCCRKSCLAVAEILRDIRGDNGLDVSQRYRLLQDRAAEAPPLPQLVRVAELSAAAESLLEKATPDWTAGVAKEGAGNRVELQEWVDYAHRTAEALKRRGVLALECFNREHARLNKAIYELHARARNRPARRQADASVLSAN